MGVKQQREGNGARAPGRTKREHRSARPEGDPADAARATSIPPLASRGRFYSRVRRSALASITLVTFSLAIGAIGYRALLPDIGWIDALHKAAMILSGMGPVEPFLKTPGGKIFETIYALYSGVVLLAATAMIVAPAFHRLLHRFRLEDSRD